MSKLEPYHTTSDEYRQVYHIYATCPEGMKITDENRKDGRGEGRELCAICDGIYELAKKRDTLMGK